MIQRTRSRTGPGRATGSLLFGLLLAGWAGAGGRVKDNLDFAAEMARQGNWREARYRWEQVAAARPDEARVLNNLAVSLEALGEPERARPLYERAVSLSGGDERIDNNRRRFARFWRERLGETAAGQDGADVPASAVEPPDLDQGKGKALKVTVPLPVPARLELEGDEKLLVASFLTEATTLLDTKRELVRFLRSEFRKRSALDVLDVTPAPEVPEQTLEDLIANRGFWQYLGREYGAELIVSGTVTYDRRDASGFQTVDRTSARTGQKVRVTEFVEQEEFVFVVELIFMDGATGTLRHRDRLQRGLSYRGQQNDPISAFYELAEMVASDVLAVVTPRTRQELRIIFKN